AMILLAYLSSVTAMHFWQQLSDWFPHLWLGISTLWALYIIMLCVWIVLQKREAAATLSWVFSLAFFPVLGFVIYHFFGPQRIRRQKSKRLRSKAQLGKQVRADSNIAQSSLSQLAETSTGFPASSAERATLLVGGNACYEALLKAIGQAKQHVHLEYYIFEPDRTGTQFRDALIERAKQGVKVRLLLDAIGSARMSNSFLKPLLDAGAEVAFFHRTRIRLRGLWKPKINLRSHRKIVVIDGTFGFTGGINICDEENDGLNKAAYRDLHIAVSGDVVRWLQLAFLEDWVYAGKHLPKEAGLFAEQSLAKIKAQIIPGGPDGNWESIHQAFVFAISQAQQRVWLATPYFVPSESARMALVSAALRGLDVRLIVPAKSDSRLVDAAARSYFEDLQAAGIIIYYYPKMLHTKALLIDAETSILGSSNFDNRSFRLNFELCILLEDSKLALALNEILLEDMHKSKKMPKHRELSFLNRLSESFARLLSPLL
ncbi:MAG: cardiolipin synthase, partial [Arenimonas sp.]